MIMVMIIIITIIVIIIKIINNKTRKFLIAVNFDWVGPWTVIQKAKFDSSGPQQIVERWSTLSYVEKKIQITTKKTSTIKKSIVQFNTEANNYNISVEEESQPLQ